MPKTNWTESALSRAWNEAKSAQRTIKFIWLGQFVLGGAGIAGFTATADGDASAVEYLVRGVCGGLAGLTAFVLPVLLFHLVRAPFRQRDEARRKLTLGDLDDVDAAMERLARAQIGDRFGRTVNALELFALLAVPLIQGMDRSGIHGKLREYYTADDLGPDLADFAIDRISLAELLIADHIPGASPEPTGRYRSYHAMPRTIYRLNGLGIRLYNRLED